MLYDQKWNKPKVNPFTIESLTAWLEKQNPRKRYCWVFVASCPLTCYFKEMGVVDYEFRSAFLGNYYTEFGRIIGIGSRLPWSTYGAALKRARELANEHS